MIRLERVDPFEKLEDWENLYSEGKNDLIFAHPKWVILSAEYSGGEPRYWTVLNEKPIGYVSGVYYTQRETLIVPVFDPIFAPYSDFVILPQYKTSALRSIIESLKKDYKKVLVGPIREDSPSISVISNMGKIISNVNINYIRLKGDPLEHIYRLKSYGFIKAFDNMERKMNFRVEVLGFENLDELLKESYKLSPQREFILRSVLSAYKDRVKMVKVSDGSKTLGYTLIFEGNNRLLVLINTVPEDKILLGIWKYIYDSGKRDITLEIPIPNFTFDRELGFRVIKGNIYEIT